MATEKRILSLNEIHALAAHSLVANGCDDANANAVAETVTAAERDGCPGHGLIRMPGYIATLRSGKVDGKARPGIDRIAPSVLRIDAGGGFAPLALKSAQTPLADLARSQGLALGALTRAHHFAALWVEVEALALEGLCAIACTCYMPAMPPAGGAEKLYGTNPFAFGWPRRDGPPVVFDMATAARARGDLMVAAREGHSVPEGTGLDADGQPTTDPQAILDGGMVLPFGGYKGSNIAMMVELLSAALIGDRFSFEAAEADNKDGGPPRGGEFLLVMDPSRTAGPDWPGHSEAFFARLLGIEGARLPGSSRHRHRAVSERDGVAVPEDLIRKVGELTKQ